MQKGLKFNKILLMLIVIFMFFPLMNARAEDTRTCYISGYTINVIVNRDGSADIEERLTYNFNGQFNGALRDIDFSLTGGLINQKVYIVKNGVLNEFRLNSDKSLDAPGQPGTYNYTKEGTLAHFKMFEPSSNEEKTFVIKYKLLDVVTKYNDIAEFNRKLIDSGWQNNLNNIKINITLPEGAGKEDIKVFAHGPLTGESTILDGRNVEFKVPTVSPGTFVETLVLFPPKLLGEVKNTINENALQGILDNESKLAEEANKQREEARNQVQEQQQQQLQQLQLQAKQETASKVAAVPLILIWFLIIIYLYIKFGKEDKPSFQGKYYRELPGEYSPAEMSVLMFSGNLNSRNIMATLMDLVRKKQLMISTNKIYKKGIFNSKEVKEYVITLMENSTATEIKKHEKFLISWFISKIGNGTSVTLDEIKDYVKVRSNALKFKGDFDKWEKLVREEAARNKFFNDSSKKGNFFGILGGIAYIMFGIVTVKFFVTLMTIILVFLGLIMLVFSASMKKRSPYGNEQYAMWLAFKRFLTDFSRLDKAEIPSIVLWEHFLVYAISLGVAKEVIKQLPIVFKDDDLNNNHLTFMYGANYGYFSGFSTMFDSTIHTVDSAMSTATSIANSVNSSSSGSGGGFSGGSSGGGGGCGGGGGF